MKYERPTIEIIEASTDLLLASEFGPGATDIGAPSVSNDAKEYSVWDEEDNTLFNIKEEQDYENWN